MLNPDEIVECRINFRSYIKTIFKYHYRVDFVFKPHHEELIEAMVFW